MDIEEFLERNLNISPVLPSAFLQEDVLNKSKAMARLEAVQDKQRRLRDNQEKVRAMTSVDVSIL